MSRLRYLLAAVAVSLLAAGTLAGAAEARVSYERPVRPALPQGVLILYETAKATTSMCGGLANGCSDGERVVLNAQGDYPRWTLAHELGHVADARSMSDAERASFSQLPWTRRSVEADAGWWGYDDGDAYIYGYAEVFADAFASCRFGELPQIKPSKHGTVVESFGGYGYDPGTNNRARRTCARIARWLSTPRTTD